MKLIIEIRDGEYGADHTFCIEYESKDKLILDLLYAMDNMDDTRPVNFLGITLYKCHLPWIINKQIYTLEEWVDDNLNNWMYDTKDPRYHKNQLTFLEIFKFE